MATDDRDRRVTENDSEFLMRTLTSQQWAVLGRKFDIELKVAKELAWHEGHHRHAPVPAFGDTPCDCDNPYRI